MTVIAKSAKRHPAAKKFCGWEEPAIWKDSILQVCKGIIMLVCMDASLQGSF